jgi:hypothetical protein
MREQVARFLDEPRPALQVGAGAELFSRAGEHDHPDFVRLRNALERMGQLVVQNPGERVHGRAVQRQRRHVAIDRDL